MFRPGLAGSQRDRLVTLGVEGKSSQVQKQFSVEIEGVVLAQGGTAVVPDSAARDAEQIE